MPEYFYTVDMGPVLGARLEKLAASAGVDDVEAFARQLLAMAIDLREQMETADTRLPGQPGGVLDDDLPF